MFKKIKKNSHFDLYKSPTFQLGNRATKKHTDSNALHNQFYSIITAKIDKVTLKPHFKDGKLKSSNAYVSVLISMSFLKESCSYGDDKLFILVEFDLLNSKTIGLEIFDDVPPSLEPYYLFRLRICDYETHIDIDLMKKCFEQVAGDTMKKLFSDGAYHQSPEQREFAKDHDEMESKTDKMQGICRFILDRRKNTDEQKIINTKPGEIIEANYVRQPPKYGKRSHIPLENVKLTYPWRYFTEKEVENSELKHKMQHRRNNLEAAMFKYSLHTRNGELRYIGSLKHRLHTFNICLWTNLHMMVIFQNLAFQRMILAILQPRNEFLGDLSHISDGIFCPQTFLYNHPDMDINTYGTLVKYKIATF